MPACSRIEADGTNSGSRCDCLERVGADHPVRALTTMPVDVRADRLHLFDSKTGLRLG
jgi:hypothetical protein